MNTSLCISLLMVFVSLCYKPINENEKISIYQSCDWPEDTIINVSNLAVELNMKELEALGFLFIDSSKITGSHRSYGGIYYKNEFNGDISAFDYIVKRTHTGISGRPNRLSSRPTSFNIKSPTQYPFYPIYTSDIMFPGDFNIPTRAINKTYLDNFEKYRHQLVPVKFKEDGIGRYVRDTFYFLGSPEFFSKLPGRYSYLEARYHCIQQLHAKTGRRVIYYNDDEINSMGNRLTLSNNILESIGFTFSDTAIHYAQYLKNCSVNLMIQRNKIGNNYKADGELENPNGNVRLLIVTDAKGHQIFQYACGSPASQTHSLLQGYDFLVPMVLSRQKYPDFLWMDLIFWFEPTDSLFAKLPPEIGEELKRDYEYLTAEDRSDLEAKCTFFTICKTELKINAFNLYPNPASEKVNINFTLSEDLKASVGIYDLQGKLIKQSITDQQYTKGMNAAEISLNGLVPGVYLLKMSTSNGYKMVRFIKD